MRQRTKAYIFSGMFLGLMILPRLLFIPLKDYVDTENYENRVYQEKPELTVRNLKSYPGQYDAYFNDHLAFKNPIVAFGKLADIRVFGEVSSDAVLMGRDGWMFYKLKGEMEDSIADYQGTNHYSEQELERFAALLEQADRNLSSRGMRLILYIVPNKEQVYSQYMPSSVKVVDEQSKADLLYTYLREHTDADVYYPLEEFKKAKDEWCQIYRKYDTHWNDMGAFMASQMIIQDIGGEVPEPKSYMDYEIEDRGAFSGDLAVMLNLQKYYNDDAFLKVAGYKDDVTYVMDYQNERETITHYSSDADAAGAAGSPGAAKSPGADRLLVCRDSFGVHMAEYFAKTYPDVTLMDYRTEDCSGAAWEIQPDVVVIEVAERYTDYMFGLLEGLGLMGQEQSAGNEPAIGQVNIEGGAR